MKKIYSLLMLAIMAIGISFQANAAVTVNVNQTGIGVLYYKSFGSSGETTITAASTELPNDCGGDVVGEIHCPTGYTMTATYTNSNATNATANISDYDGEHYISVNPETAPDGTVFNITVTAGGGGGGGGEVEEQTITFIFSPAGSGYVVTTHANDGGTTVEDETYRPAEGSEEVEVPYTADGSYLIKPNAGYALTNAKDETQTSNPHYEGIKANPDDGFIHGSMAMVSAGAQIVVTAVKSGTFSVKGVGENIANIQMQNLSDFEMVTVTTDETQVQFKGGTQYKIYSGSTTGVQLWKVEVTDSDDYTTEIEGTAGNFTYTPNDGDKVVIYSDKPEQHAQIKISYEGEGVTSSVIKKVMYGSAVKDESAWKSGEWNEIAGDYLVIMFEDSGFTNFSCKVNGVSKALQSNADGKYLGISLDNGSETVKEYAIVISAQKEQQYNVTFVCEHPEAVEIAPNGGGTAFSFTSSGQSFKIAETANTLKFSAKSGWSLDGILVDGELPKTGDFVENTYSVDKDCTITINVSSKAEKRTKTAVVYVDESVANPTYLDFKFAGEQTSQTIKPGYNFIKFCDEDCPFSFGYYAGGDAQFYVNGSKITTPISCPETLDFEDGGVIKYVNGTPTQQVVTYNIASNIANQVEIWHDYTVSIDHSAAQEYSVFKGTLIHIKPKSIEAPASVRRRVQSATTSFTVKVNNEAIQPDEDGVYTVKVGDTAPTISITKAGTTGIEGINAADSETFTIFNLQGMTVKTGATAADFNSLPAGIYIANGSKVIVK